MISQQQTIYSEQDNSVNFIDTKTIGFSEARYVRRADDYFITYLSSMTGCPKGCQFCHLTASNQTAFLHTTQNEFLEQANSVFDHYKQQNEARVVHYNFMARGEALANPNLLNNGYNILKDLTDLAVQNKLVPKFNISTIMPYEMLRRELSDVFPGITPTIYYSLYSMDTAFRKRWLPAAIDPQIALDKLKKYQQDTKKIIKLHWAFIDGENDDLETLSEIVAAVKQRELKVEFNLVRYNPYSPIQGKESSDKILNRNLAYLAKELDSHSKLIERVGFDVKASCGMFVE